jgi:hypothetical protein
MRSRRRLSMRSRSARFCATAFGCRRRRRRHGWGDCGVFVIVIVIVIVL